MLTDEEKIELTIIRSNPRRMRQEFLKTTKFWEAIDKFKHQHFNMRERIDCLLYDHEEQCYCGNPLKYGKQFCSPACVARDETIKKETGRKNSLNKETRNKAREKTCLEVYGTKSYSGTKEHKEKVKKTCQEKYGVDHYTNLEKNKQTCMEKYGTEYYYQTDEFKLNLAKLNLELYGVDHFSKTDLFKEKMIQTSFEKYGIDNYGKSKESIEKAINTCLTKYGSNNYIQSEEYTNYCVEKYGAKTYFSSQQFESICKPKISKAENDITECFKDLGFEFKRTRDVLDNGKELDGYCKDKNVAFEFNGLYWHSELFQTDKNYHYYKYKNCSDKNILLFTIFEDEWDRRQKQVKQFLRAKLGSFDKRIYARECKIVIDQSPKLFFSQNHIQGAPNKIDFDVCLKYDDKIVSSMSFGLHHRNNKDMTLNRYTTEGGYQIVGGATRLFKNAIKHLQCDLITWSDNRWTDGKLYENIGFTLQEESNPDYSYTKSQNRYSKQSLQKSRTNCPANKTEHEWAIENKYYRIYDCGKKKWVYKHKKES